MDYIESGVLIKFLYALTTTCAYADIHYSGSSVD